MSADRPSRETRSKYLGWACTGLLWLCSCATADECKRPSPLILPPEDLACESDDDCGIVGDGSVFSCSSGPKVEPYAISHAAAHRHRADRVCDRDEELIRIIGCCHTSPEDWIAVCSNHLCKRRKVHFFSSPEVHCPR
jgi:hypothetical protein